jgi:tRNA threonylcarbamoyladenosine biosynthesis protein TsaE
MQFLSRSTLDTEMFAARVACTLVPGDCVALSGGLGAGKTTFVRGLLRGRGYGGRVQSPTYALAARYDLDGVEFYHFDAYLSEKERQFMDEGGVELLYGPVVSIVEWPERLGCALERDFVEIRFVELSENERQLEFSARGARSAQLLDAWRRLTEPAAEVLS